MSAVAFIALAGVSLYRYYIDSGFKMEVGWKTRIHTEQEKIWWNLSGDRTTGILQLLFTEILPGEGYASADRPVSNQSGDEMRKAKRMRFSTQSLGSLRGCNGLNFRICWQGESDLPAYRKPSPNVQDETDSEIRVIWRTDDGNEIQKLSGSHAEALETLVLSIAEEACHVKP